MIGILVVGFVIMYEWMFVFFLFVFGIYNKLKIEIIVKNICLY